LAVASLRSLPTGPTGSEITPDRDRSDDSQRNGNGDIGGPREGVGERHKDGIGKTCHRPRDDPGLLVCDPVR